LPDFGFCHPTAIRLPLDCHPTDPQNYYKIGIQVFWR
jgi:hypothetical protein